MADEGRSFRLSRVKDHFSLPHASSEIKYRRTNVRVYPQHDSQWIVREHHDENGDFVNVGRVDDGSYGVTFLRLTYCSIAVFVAAFAFIFAMELLLFLFVDLAVAFGASQLQGADGAECLNILLSIPLFVYGFAMLMTVVTRFVSDLWVGHPFLDTFGGRDRVAIDWVTFASFLGVPALTAIVTLMTKKSNWWEITITTWFNSVACFLGCFMLCLLYYEVRVCLQVVSEDGQMGAWERIKLAVRYSVVSQLEGYQYEMSTKDADTTALTIWSGVNSVSKDDKEKEVEEPIDSEESKELTVSVGLYSRLTRCGCFENYLYRNVDPPRKIWTVEEARGLTAYATRDTWSLEKTFCRNTNRPRTAVVVSGPSSITKRQAKSSLVCLFLGNVMMLLFFVGFLVWMGAGGAIAGIAGILIALCSVPRALHGINMWRNYKSITKREQEKVGDNLNEDDDHIQYKMLETKVITEPTEAFVWIVFALKVILFWLWPLVHLFSIGNFQGGIFFTILGLAYQIWHYLDPVVQIKRRGNFSIPTTKTEVEFKTWKKMHRLSQITRVGRDRAQIFWSRVFILIVVFYVLIFLAAFATVDVNQIQNLVLGDTNPNDQLILAQGSFEFPEDKYNRPYPTCTLHGGFGRNHSIPEASSLIDHVFLANVAYVRPGGTQYLMDQWFGEGVTKEEIDVVTTFKENQNTTKSLVSYKLVTFANDPSSAVVAIRGTENLFDIMADAQLWLAAGLFQCLRFIMPGGSVWTPVLHELIRAVSALQTRSLRRVSFYMETADFVRHVRDVHGRDEVRIVGHSLGGGLALVTGAQTNSTAVGLSAPNTVLSRDSFTPPVDLLSLDRLTFNVIPDRDVVPMLDDRAASYQRIDCRTAANDFASCHQSKLSLCELIYRCGRGGRPMVCGCEELGYPEPVSTSPGSQSYKEACDEAERLGNEEAARLDAT